MLITGIKELVTCDETVEGAVDDPLHAGLGVLRDAAVVIGGGLSRAGGALFDELRTRLAARLSFHRIPELVPAELSGNAGLLGAALRARELT